MRIIQGGAYLPQVAVCAPSYDAESLRTQRWRDAVIAHSDPILVRWVIADCQRELAGYTRPMNLAVRAALETCPGVPYVAALNDDVEVADGWLAPLLAALDKGAWCATPDATHTDGPQVFHPYCMVWTSVAWQYVGGLDERFVIHGSDIDVARRLVDAGHPPVKVRLPAYVRHQLNATTEEHPAMGPIAAQDLARYEAKWGISAEEDKHRLAALVGG